MTQSVEVLGKPGRPYIGPKAQTHIWPHIHGHAEEEAKRSGRPLADVWREMLEEAYAARVGSGGAA